MSPDDSQFEQLYQSLPAGLVVAACTSKSFEMTLWSNGDILTSFCRSIKGAAIRCGSNAMHFWWGYSRKNWKTRGIEHFRSFVEKHSASGIRMFLINKPINNSIDHHIAGLIGEASLAKNVTAIVTIIAEDVQDGLNKTSLAVRDHKDIRFGKGGSAFILLECDRTDDNWYSASVFDGLKAKHYGPLYLVWECPQAPEPQPGSKAEAANTQPQPNPESAVDLAKTPETQKGAGVFRRFLATLGF